MKLYMHPASTTCRPVMQFIADNKIAVEEQVVDLFKGEHYGEAYTRINPSRLVPLLEDGDFRLSESATILRYLADTVSSACYPKDLKKRAKVDELLDWFNSNFYRDWGYNLIYPQVFPQHKRAEAAAQSGVVNWGVDKSKHWLNVLEHHWIGARRTYLTGELSIADYFGCGLVTVGELIHLDYGAYPNIGRWLAAMKARPSYGEVYKVFNGFVESTKDQQFTRV
jgi:glutathione S-transferase